MRAPLGRPERLTAPRGAYREVVWLTERPWSMTVLADADLVISTSGTVMKNRYGPKGENLSPFECWRIRRLPQLCWPRRLWL